MAGKFTTLMLTMGGSLIVFHLLGLLDAGATNSLMNLLLNPTNLKASTFVTVAVATIAGVTLVGSIISRSFKADLAIMATIVSLLIGFAWDYLIIFQKIAAFSIPFAVLIISPFILIYVLTVLEYWRGVTT